MKSLLQFRTILGKTRHVLGMSVFLALFFASFSLSGQSCNHQLVHYNLNSCSPGSSYSEFTPNTSKPSGISTLSATNFSNNGSHSCTPRGGGKAICHSIKTGCSWSDNNSNAFKFSVTVKPSSGKEACISKLTFLEAAPLTYTWTNGGTGDNDPPSKYGIRVLKNGVEVFQQTDIPTTHGWTTETFDFSNDPDFTVTSQTTFAFELLGYCRSNGTSGQAVWDVDEIKVFGCSKTPVCNATITGFQINPQNGQPLMNLNDGMTFCESQFSTADIRIRTTASGTHESLRYTITGPNGLNIGNTENQLTYDSEQFWANPGTYTVNVKLYSQDNLGGQLCDEKTISFTVDDCSVPCYNQGGDADGDGVCANSDCDDNDASIGAPGDSCDDGNPNTTNDTVQNDCTCAGTPVPCAGQGGDSDGDGVCDNQDCRPNDPNISNPGDACDDGNPNTNNDVIQQDCSCVGTPVNPCAGQGGDSDGDGVCDNQDCRPNDPNISNPGDACDDGNPNTNNDVIQQDCSCKGTPTGGCNATYTVDGRKITVSGLTDPVTQVQITDANWAVIYSCDSWDANTPNCGTSTMFTVPSDGTYYIFIKTYSSSWTNICNIFETITIGGTPPPPVCRVTASYSNVQCHNQGTATPADDTYSFDVTATITNGGAWGYTVVGTNVDHQTNGSTATVTGLLISGGTRTFTIIDADDPNCMTTITVTPPAPCSTGNPCAGQGGDSDGDGVCNNEDCRPYDANISRPGDACDDGDSNTNNDVIQQDCSCKGTPNGGNTCNATFAVNGNTITVNGLNNDLNQVQILDGSFANLFDCNSWNGPDCGSSVTYTVPGNGTYYLFIKSYTSGWSPICNIFETITIGGNPPPVCSITASYSNVRCYDQSTGDPQDDTYSFDVTATITNGGAWGYTVLGTNIDHQTNGSTATVSGLLISGGTRTFTIIDADDPNCSTTITVTPPAPCSSGDPCALLGGDSDGDGVCNMQDCRPYDPNISRPGDACDDGDSNTSNDVIQSDCSCKGTPSSGCTAMLSTDGLKITVTGLNYPITNVKVSAPDWTTIFECNSWGGTPCGSTVMYTVPSSGTYYVTVKAISADWSTTICDIFETVNLTGPSGCDNVTNGGTIAGDEANCGGYDPAPITNVTFPTGGTGALEYIWLSSTTGCPNSLAQQIPGASGATYDPGYISQTTYYRRCARRAGCTDSNSWLQGESNCVVKTVNTNCNMVCADRDATNSNSSCGAGQGYGFYAKNFISGAGQVNDHYSFTNGEFVENTDGTARLTGTAVNWNNANISFDVDVTFSGRTTTPPQGSPKGSNCGHYNINTTDWYYYSSFTGMLTGTGTMAGAKVNVSSGNNPAYQVGTGANGNDEFMFGASGWMDYTVTMQPNSGAVLNSGVRMDFNIRLTGNSSPCLGTNRTQILGLDASLHQGIVDVSWTSNEGFKTDYFEVERSDNGVDFISIIESEVVSDDDTPRLYRTADKTPLTGANFYRVKLVYLDGTVEHSDVKRVNISDVEDFGLFPNPAFDNVRVSLRGYEGRDIEIRLVDRFGKQLQTIQLDNVSDTSYEIPLTNVRNGMYHVWIFANNRKPIGKKVIVNKMY